MLADHLASPRRRESRPVGAGPDGGGPCF